MPSSSQSWRVNEATEVLPLVPVTATAMRGWRAEEPRRHPCKPAAGIGVLDHRRAVQAMIAAFRHSTAAAPRCNGVGDEPRAVGAGAGQGGKQIAGLDGAAVGRQPQDRDLPPRRGGFGPDQLA